MSGGGGFFASIVRYLIQDVAVKILAENKGFQRFVLRIDTFFVTSQKAVESKAEDMAKGAEKVVAQAKADRAASAANPKAAVSQGFDATLFMKHLRAEISKDINQLSGK
jgi:hypothetical protein